MRISPAQPRHAEQGAEVIRRSITELCGADHHDDPALLEPWLANKTPENFERWLHGRDNIVVVAVDDENTVWAVGGCTRDGEIALNYVSPDARFTGLSLAILTTLESRLRMEKTKNSRLVSTETAHVFYLRRGFRDDGRARPDSTGLLGQPMVKQLIF